MKKERECFHQMWPLYNYKTEIEEFIWDYHIIEVDWLSIDLVNVEMKNHEYLKRKPKKRLAVRKMLQYYLEDENAELYKKIDYLCDTKEKICVININAEKLREIFDGKQYKKDVKYISWFIDPNSLTNSF